MWFTGYCTANEKRNGCEGTEVRSIPVVHPGERTADWELRLAALPPSPAS